MMLIVTWFIESAVVAAVALLVAGIVRRWSPAAAAAVLLVSLVKFAIPPAQAWFGVTNLTGWSLLDVAIEIATWFDIPLPRLDVISASAVPFLVVYAIGLTTALANLARDLRHAPPTAVLQKAGEGLQEVIAVACDQMGLRRRPELFVSDAVTTSFASGVFRPRVVLPASLSPESARHVIWHELAHHRRGDVAVLYAEALLRAVWWFHPLLPLVIRQLHAVREEACDAMAVACGGIDEESYCRSLLAAAARPRPSFAAPWSEPPLRRRITMVMTAGRRSPFLSAWQRAAIAAGALLSVPAFLTRPGIDTLISLLR